MAWIMSLNKNRVFEKVMRCLRECLMSAERGPKMVIGDVFGDFL